MSPNHHYHVPTLPHPPVPHQAPEMDPSLGLSAVLLLAGLLMVLRARQ